MLYLQLQLLLIAALLQALSGFRDEVKSRFRPSGAVRIIQNFRDHLRKSVFARTCDTQLSIKQGRLIRP